MKKMLLIIWIFFLLFSCWSEREDLLFKEKALKWEEVKILALWDSITYWYKVKPEESYPSQLEAQLQNNGYNYSIKNFWISWNTSQQLLDRLDEILDNNEADIAIICIGWNDGLRKKSLSNMKSNIEEIIRKTQEKNIHVVFVWMELPIIFWWDYSSDFENVFVNMAEEKTLDFYPYLLEWIWLKVEYNQSDNIHPTALWYTLISNNMYEFLEDGKLLYKKEEN